MKLKLVVLFFISVLSVTNTKSQQINKPLTELVPKSDIIVTGVVTLGGISIMRERDARVVGERVPNSDKVITQLPQVGKALGCLYRVRVQEIAKQHGETKRVRVGDSVDVFIAGPCFGTIDTVTLPRNKVVMLILSRSALNVDVYADAVIVEPKGAPGPYPRFDRKNCFVLTGGIASVISVREEPDKVNQVKMLLINLRSVR